MALTPNEKRYLQALQRQQKIYLARDNLLDFAQFMMPDPNYPDDVTKSLYEIAAHHQVIAQAIERVERGGIKRLIITVPPRHGKSQLSSRLGPAWYAGRHPEKSLILATYADKLSWDFGREVAALLEDNLYRQVFPNFGIKTASVDRIETDKGGKLFFVGRGSSITGRGAHGLLIDDPLKDRKEADSPVTREGLWTWFNQVARTRLASYIGWIIIITTRWSEDDLVGRLTDPQNPSYSPIEGPKWQVLDLPALALDNDPLGRKVGEALWPSHFPESYLAELQAVDPRGFQALYQGAPTPDKGNFFPADKLLTYRPGDLPKTLRYYAASDIAVSTRQDRDKSCLMVVGLDDEQNIWVMPDLVWARIPSDQVVERMIDLMERYKPMHWWGEKGQITKSIGPFLRKRMLERGVFCSVYEMTPIVDKMARAQSIMARMAMGKVFWPQHAGWWAAAQRELLQFPHSARDDLVDAISYIGMGLTYQVGAKPKAKAAKIVKPGSLAWVKQASVDEKRRRQAASGGW